MSQAGSLGSSGSIPPENLNYLTSFSGEIDMTYAGVQDIFVANNNLQVFAYSFRGVNITDIGSTPIFNIGTNAPDYDNILSGIPSNLINTNDCFNGSIVGSAVIPAGTMVRINITSTSIATTNVQNINLICFKT